MTNVDRAIQASQRRRQDYILASIRCLLQGENSLFALWSKRAESEKENIELFRRFRDLLDAERPAPDFLPEEN